MFLKHLALGFIVKAIASFDDTLTRIPIITHLTRTRKGKIAFSIGTLLAITLAIAIATFFSSLLNLIPYQQFVISGLIFALAIMIYFNIFISKTEMHTEKKLLKVPISTRRVIKLIFTGFIISGITLIDDTVVLTPVFSGNLYSKLAAALGVYLATVIQVTLVIFFAEKAAKIRFKKEIAAGGLVFLGILILLGVV